MKLREEDEAEEGGRWDMVLRKEIMLRRERGEMNCGGNLLQPQQTRYRKPEAHI